MGLVNVRDPLVLRHSSRSWRERTSFGAIDKPVCKSAPATGSSVLESDSAEHALRTTCSVA